MFSHLSGGYWHARMVQVHPRHGLWSRRPTHRLSVRRRWPNGSMRRAAINAVCFCARRGCAFMTPRPISNAGGQGVAPEFIKADGVHGNARHGAALMAKIYECGLLPRASAAACS